MSEESMQFDVVIVGAGPAGLSAAIRLKQLCKQHGNDLSVCVLEKGAEVGAHILSGAVIEPTALDELLPDWQNLNAPIATQVTDDHFLFLTETRAQRLPTPPHMQNHGNYIVSLGEVCRWLAEQATQLGVDIFPGFAAAELILDDKNQVGGVITGAMGINKSGEHGENFQPGMRLQARMTLLAEGCRGNLSQLAIEKFKLRTGAQSYGIGIKEIWEVSDAQSHPGSVTHTIGWPLDQNTYGGSFIYHLDNNKVAVGFVVGLDYQNPTLDPYAEMQRFKTHPHIRAMLEGGQRLSYGARALNEGGWQSIPDLSFPGGALIGCAAGFMNVPKIKGSHTAMKSAMIAAEQSFAKLTTSETTDAIYLTELTDAVKKSWVGKELYRVRNIRMGFRWGLWAGLSLAALDSYIFRGHTPWTFKPHADHLFLKPIQDCTPIKYDKADGALTFDKLSSVYLSNTNHSENQPSHLVLKEEARSVEINLKRYGGPEQFYCPAGVYEYVEDSAGKPRLQINAQNCVHCKTCDIKDPTQNIQWIPPEGGGGPMYSEM